MNHALLNEMPPSCTCCIRDPVRMPGVLAAVVGASTLRRQLHGVGERSVADLVGGRDFHQVDAPGLQLLQQGHRMGPWKEERKHTTRIRTAKSQCRCTS